MYSIGTLGIVLFAPQAVYHVGRCIIYSVLNSEGPLLDVPLNTNFLSFTYVDK